MPATRDPQAHPEKLNAQERAAQTDTVARSIISAEEDARIAKTERLRALRLKREADDRGRRKTRQAETPPTSH